MEPDLIIINEYCIKSNVDPTFLLQLEEEGIIEVELINGEKYITAETLSDIEKYISWHYDLSVNIEGIDVIRHLLAQMESMQYEISQLRNHLNFYKNYK